MNIPARIASLAICIATLGICVAAPCAAAQPVKVGFIGPLAGPASDFGNSALLGLQLAVTEINSVGGYLGRPVQLVVRDDKGLPDEGRKAAEDLVKTEKVAFTIAGGGSGATLKMLDVFQDNKHVLMVGMATATAITKKYPASESFVFRNAAPDSLQASFLVDELVKSGVTRIAVLADTTGYGEGGVKDVLRFLAAKSLEPAYVGRFEVGVPSVDDHVLAARAAGAEALISYTVGPEHALIARTRAKLKVKFPQYAPWTGSSRVVWDRANKDANGLIFVQSIIPDISNERRSSFILRLTKQAAGRPVPSLMAAAQHYDAMYLLLTALFQAKGNTSGVALKQALENLDRSYSGVVTTYDKPFSQTDHDSFTQNMTWLAVWRDGEIRFLHREDARRASYVRRKTDQG